jgi:cell division protein FtsZ
VIRLNKEINSHIVNKNRNSKKKTRINHLNLKNKMEDMLKFEMPKNQSSIIKVLGVGGGGSNAVNHMYNQGITGVDFVVCNTDAQALDMSPVPNKISLGEKGLGAGSKPSVAEKAAIDKSEEIKKILSSNTEMLFITAGMGGGTGTGAAPIIARLAKEIDLNDEDVNKILVVAIVTKPFSFEGRKRKLQADKGIEELRKYADAVLIISNDKLRELYGDLGLTDAFRIADNVLLTAAKGIAEIITVRANVNIDFKDVNTVMKDSGVAIMGTGIAEGEGRAKNAIEQALNSPLLDDNDITGTNNILLYMASGKKEISMDEITEITEYILKKAGEDANIIWGAGKDESLGEQISITIVATGFKKEDKINEPKVIKDLYSGNSDTNKDPNLPRPTRPAYEPPVEENGNDNNDSIRLIRKDDPKRKDNNESDHVGAVAEKRNVIVHDLDDPVPEIKFVVNHEQPQPPEKEYRKQPVAEVHPNEPVELFRKKEISKPGILTEEEKTEHEKRALDRVEKLRQLSMKLKTPGGLADLENEPAFRRRNVELSDEKPSEDTRISRYTLSNDEEEGTTLRSDNSFLHDNVD